MRHKDIMHIIMDHKKEIDTLVNSYHITTGVPKDDLRQEAYLKIMQITSRRPLKTSLPYIRRVIINRFNTIYRRRQKQPISIYFDLF